MPSPYARSVLAATALLSAASMAGPLRAQPPVADIARAAPGDETRVACLVDSAFGFHADTPIICFATTQAGIAAPRFWDSFGAVVPKPERVDDVAAAYDIRSGTAVIGDVEADISPKAVQALGNCWARIEHMRAQRMDIPAAPCLR